MRAADGSAFPYRVLGDQPYVADGDPFDFVGLASDLKKLILASRASTPFTIGIEASWGRGKSSLMAQLERQLQPTNDTEEDVEIKTVKFNAWTAEGEDVLEGLIKSVLEAMDSSVLRRALRKKRLLSGAKIALLLLAGPLRVGALVNEAWDKLSADAHTRNQVNDLVREAMNNWFAGAREAPEPTPNKLLVVFIDDLDRCSPENVLKIFEGLKLYLDARGFVFVIGYDEGIVSEAVVDQKRYSARTTGRDYIEKIVQIVFRIPQPTDDEVESLLTRFLEDSQTVELFDEPARKLVIDRNGRNPRRIKRFVNRFILDYQLDEASQDLDPELLIKLLILETYFPEFARLFTVPSEKNPIQEFLDFADARDRLRRGFGDETDTQAVDEVFVFYGIGRGESHAQSLELLQREAPEPFLRLVQDDDFTTLAASLRNPDEQALILAKVQRRKERDIRVEPVAAFAKSSGVEVEPLLLPPVAGRRIIWIDDHPEKNVRLAELLKSVGASLELAADGDSAAGLLASGPVDLIISDVGRGERLDAGFEDLEAFRERGLYDGHVIFFTARVSAARRARAAELGSQIASDDSELFEAIAQAIRTAVPA